MVPPEKYGLPEAGMWGFSHCGSFDSLYPWSGLSVAERIERLVRDLVEVGADSFRPHVHWHIVEPALAAGLACPEDVTDELVSSYAGDRGGMAWAAYDLMIDRLVSAGITPHVVLAAGYDFELPVSTEGRTCARATPDCAGLDRYLGQAYLHARAVVRRYKGRVNVWQLENELNVAGETMLLARWRSSRSWFDRGFQDALMGALSAAVREEDPGALTSHNFHTDIRLVRGAYHWTDDVLRWSRHIDIVGIDTFPNYLIGWPSRGGAVGKKVIEAREVAGGRPVVVMESGYPARPPFRGMSEARQASYVCDALASAARAGARGFYYYCLCSPEGFPVQGPWSNRLVQAVEPWWGFIRSDDSKRAAWFECRRALEDARTTAMNMSV